MYSGVIFEQRWLDRFTTGSRIFVILNGHGPQVWILQELATEISAISRKYAGRELGGSWRTASLVNFSGNTAGPRLTRRLPWCKRPNQCRFTGFFSAASTWRRRFPRDGWSATPFPSTVIQYTQGLGLPKDKEQAKADEYSQITPDLTIATASQSSRGYLATNTTVLCLCSQAGGMSRSCSHSWLCRLS
jgi:hypothetical protein